MDSIKREIYENHGEHGSLLIKSISQSGGKLVWALGKAITGIIGSIRKLTTEYFDIYGRDVKKDTVAIGGGSMSGGDGAIHEPDEETEINEP